MIAFLDVQYYVWLDESRRPGLGAKLFQTLGEPTLVIGVAKTRFRDAPGIDVYRNGSLITASETREGLCVLTADVPLVEMFNYASELRSVTQGQGSFSMEFSRYTKAPRELLLEVSRGKNR